ncbi:MAG: putative monovalent cation/H+ antiporter subunit A [Bacteroidales bacterium]
MLIAVLAGFALSVFVPLIHRLLPRISGLIFSLLPAVIFLWFLYLLPSVVAGEGLWLTYNWIPALDIELSFFLDGLSLFFVLLISGFGFFIFLYSSSYLKGHRYFDRFFIYLFLFMSSMLGLVLSGNLISMFVFWELTSLSSYMLIGFYNENEISRKNALQAMLVTVLGGLAMMAGIILTGIMAGSYCFSELLNSREVLQDHPWYLIALVLMLLGAFTKSAQFPFHFWLPNAMAAPAPVSAYLHSTTMVKAGIYLLARISPVFGGTPEWSFILTTFGGLTMFMGALLAIQYTDLKKILAYTTISALGVMVFLIGIGTTLAIQAAMVFLLAHALYKGTLFLVTGNIDHETGTREVNELSGLAKKLPYTAYAAVLASMSMAGVMPFFGFIAKEILYEAALDFSAGNILIMLAVFITGVIFTALAIEIAWGVFFGPFKETPKKAHEAPWFMIAGPVLFASLGLIGGLFAEFLIQPLLGSSATAVLNVEQVLKLTLWHGFTLVLLLSLLTLFFGYLIFRVRYKIRGWTGGSFQSIYRFGPAAGYQKLIPGLLSLATAQTRFFQNGSLRNYISSIVGFFTFLILLTFATRNLEFDLAGRLALFTELRIYEVVMTGLIIIAFFIIINARSRLTTLVAMGVLGYGIAVIFLFYGAPDVAMTQFLIETLTVVLFVLILHRLPSFIHTNRFEGMGYIVVSVVFGLVMASLLLIVTGVPLESELRNIYAEGSYPLGKGRNVVNVILVDFRQLDTLGEIVVLSIAAIGIFSMIKVKYAEGGNKE